MTLAADQPSLLLVDDDATFLGVLAQAFTRRGYAVQCATDADSALRMAAEEPCEYAVVDLKMPGPSGLAVVEGLHRLDPHTRVVVLTGYASIATAVEAIKLGATHYLTKPVDVDEIVRAFTKQTGDANLPIQDQRWSPERVEWEYIQRALNEHDGNISATARALGMHRRTLQRKLLKRPARR